MKKICFVLNILFSISAGAQSYPYDDSENIGNLNLPVENPKVPVPEQADVRPSNKPTSLFRMGVKFGGNFSLFQDRLCTAANATSGCQTYVNRSFNGIGLEGRISFGWDLAYQPVFLETEIGYQEKLLTIDTPLRNFFLAQGLFHRERIGAKTLWKNGVIAQLDGRFAETGGDELSFAVFPALGISTMIESGAWITQLSFYVHQFRSDRNFFSISTLVGYRF